MGEDKFKGERLDAKNKTTKNNLVQKFKKVYGVDISAEAIEYCKRYWKQKNISFLVGSGTDIPFPANAFDVVATFEVFEHISEWEKFLSELRRITKPQGKIYISTPNKDITSPGKVKPINPFHFFEMTEKQFKKALSRYFNIDSFLGQRTPIYNDHWIWKIVDPFLFTFHRVLPFGFGKSLKFKIINWIKPELSPEDIVFSDNPDWIKKSRQMLAICKNNK